MQHKPTPHLAAAPETASVVLPLADVDGMKSIRERARKILRHPPGQAAFVTDITTLVDRLFSGLLWHYQPIDLRYHDYQHTLQAAWVYLDLIEAVQDRPGVVAPTMREAELGLAAVLLHDTGYLKARGDDEGTGAKYTYCHVLRSCALAASVLPRVGCTQVEVEDVLGIIRCTGLNGQPGTTTFRLANAHLVASMVATADYLGQMAAPEYPVKIAHLFNEFAEADEYSRIPEDKRAFASLAHLIAATPGFWQKFVLPKLTNDFESVYLHLARPYPDGPNPYLIAVEKNLAAIAARSNPPFAARRV